MMKAEQNLNSCNSFTTPLTSLDLELTVEAMNFYLTENPNLCPEKAKQMQRTRIKHMHNGVAQLAREARV